MSKKLVSIVIPCYNEEKNIDRTFDGLLKIIEKHKYDFEIIAVNDGSKDGTWDVIETYANDYDEIIGVNLMSNFGQSVAYQAGFDHAQGEYIVIVAADLETPLSEIERVIHYLDDGYDLVNTNRVGRWGDKKGSRQVKSNMANKLINWISGIEIKDRGSGVKGFRDVLLKELQMYGDMQRFMPDYLSVYSKNFIEYDVEFKDRDYGESAVAGQSRTLRVLLDLLTLSFMVKFAKKPYHMMPGRLFGFTGALMAGLGGIGGVYLLWLKILGQDIGQRPLLTVSVLLIIVGLQSMMFGLLGELMLRIYFESSKRKTYAVREIVK